MADTALSLLSAEPLAGKFINPDWVKGLETLGLERSEIEQSISEGLLTVSLIERSRPGHQAVGTRAASKALDNLRIAALTLVKAGITSKNVFGWLTSQQTALDYRTPVDCIRETPNRVRVLACAEARIRPMLNQAA